MASDVRKAQAPREAQHRGIRGRENDWARLKRAADRNLVLGRSAERRRNVLIESGRTGGKPAVDRTFECIFWSTPA
jgi:hypothetical protein